MSELLARKNFGLGGCLVGSLTVFPGSLGTRHGVGDHDAVAPHAPADHGIIDHGPGELQVLHLLLGRGHALGMALVDGLPGGIDGILPGKEDGVKGVGRAPVVVRVVGRFGRLCFVEGDREIGLLDGSCPAAPSHGADGSRLDSLDVHLLGQGLRTEPLDGHDCVGGTLAGKVLARDGDDVHAARQLELVGRVADAGVHGARQLLLVDLVLGAGQQGRVDDSGHGERAQRRRPLLLLEGFQAAEGMGIGGRFEQIGVGGIRLGRLEQGAEFEGVLLGLVEPRDNLALEGTGGRGDVFRHQRLEVHGMGPCSLGQEQQQLRMTREEVSPTAPRRRGSGCVMEDDLGSLATSPGVSAGCAAYRFGFERPRRFRRVASRREHMDR